RSSLDLPVSLGWRGLFSFWKGHKRKREALPDPAPSTRFQPAEELDDLTSALSHCRRSVHAYLFNFDNSVVGVSVSRPVFCLWWCSLGTQRCGADVRPHHRIRVETIFSTNASCRLSFPAGRPLRYRCLWVEPDDGDPRLIVSQPQLLQCFGLSARMTDYYAL